MGEDRMKWVGIAEFCKGLIKGLNHLVTPVSRKRADFAGRPKPGVALYFLKHVWARLSITAYLRCIQI